MHRKELGPGKGKGKKHGYWALVMVDRLIRANEPSSSTNVERGEEDEALIESAKPDLALHQAVH
jgi:hypothetical protein